ARAVTRSARTSLLRTGCASVRESSGDETSICGAPPSVCSARRDSRPSNVSTFARRATIASSRTDATVRSRDGRESSVMSPETIRANYERIRSEVGGAVTVVAATKYVALEDMRLLADAGVEVVGENRAQELERKHAEYGDTFRWHFIGHLQSNKVKVVNRSCELVHSLDSESAASRLAVPALVE